jgi:hypothetical protein
MTEFGRPITREVAQAYITRYEKIKSAAVIGVKPEFLDGYLDDKYGEHEQEEGADKEKSQEKLAGARNGEEVTTIREKSSDIVLQVQNLLATNFNAFVFEREVVERFFNEGANYLMVMLGAKEETGLPTVVLVGVNRKDSKKKEAKAGEGLKAGESAGAGLNADESTGGDSNVADANATDTTDGGATGINPPQEQFYSLDIPDPGTEQPPRYFEMIIPPPPKNGQAPKHPDSQMTFCERNC